MRACREPSVKSQSTFTLSLCVMDGIFYEDTNGLLQFFEVDDLSVEDVDAVQVRVRKRVLSLYKRKGLLTEEDSAKLQPKKAWLNWAKLRKVYEVDPLKCEQCGETMKIIAFILDATSIQKILSHIGEDSEPPKLHPARGPPDEGYSEAGHAPEYQYDQTVNW